MNIIMLPHLVSLMLTKNVLL